MKSSIDIISLNNIRREFGSKIVLNNLNLKIKKGEFIALLGVSGSGKSTLLNIIGLLDNKYQGDYYFFGEKLNPKIDYSHIRSKKIGFIFQLYYLLPKLSIIDNILLPFLYHNNFNELDIEEKLQDLIKRLHLNDLLYQPSEVLSGGEKQRVAIARALIHNPDLIICDEPTGNLDKDNCDIIIKILKEEQQKGKTIIVVTHNDEVASYADTIYNLNRGVVYHE